MSERQKIVRVTIKDCEVQTFRSGGKGGQNQNKRDTGVRVIHAPSGARGESREERTQLLNKRAAFGRMARSSEFTRWINMETARALGEMERQVDDEMRPENLLVEHGPFAEAA